MNRRLAGIMALCIALPGIGMSVMRFRDGTARLPTGSLGGFDAQRVTNPALFWAITAFNAIVLAVIVMAGATMVVLP